ncbi:ABC transporter ATP-binding protein/permease [Flavobacterium agricola]|uniref:ABC transporter ATP-binding protein/permease n=1 Tax=Flavobacterium agricola TaxID=2870839 RepID=A0ABY6LYN6_9FLAO|nr:ABC transporter ATP-binding protein [Flavobacterium agricola]UYW00519.1 ABC transporter ATP-binding protein/permease [Flavobacterium agricola]
MNFLKNYIRTNFSNFTFFYSILKARIFIVIVLSILTGILDSIGLTMFLPLLQLADGGNQIDLGNLSFITDFLTYCNIKLTISKALVFLLLVFLVKGFVVYKTNVYKLLSQHLLAEKIRLKIVEQFSTFQYKQFVKTDIGKIQNIFLSEIARLTATFSNYISMIQGIIMITIYLIFSFMVDWQFALLVCLGGVFSDFVFKRINKLTKEKSKDISSINNRFANALIQYVNNFKYLKATGKIQDYKERVKNAIADMHQVNIAMGVLNAKVSSFREPLLIGIVVCVILLQIRLFSASISDILISLLFFYRALTSIVTVQNNYNNAIANQGAIDNIQSFFKELDSASEAISNNLFHGFNTAIQLKNIFFNYDDVNVLQNVTIEIPKNQSIALVGESGSGKTTLVNILTQLLPCEQGEFTIDGVDIRDYNAFTYQKYIGYISQESTIFNDTIYNNVTFWAPKTPENIKNFKDALKRAAIFDFVWSLKKKEETLLGNNGINLSGGQRQRISIARELFKDVQILIFDEATSALDSETEQEIQKSIDELKGQLTLVSIAHRLATIKNADVIYVLDKGQVVEYGSFDDLAKSSVRFKKMVELQEI